MSKTHMENAYNHHRHYHNSHLHYKSTYLPMLCSRPSIKDVSLPKSGSFSNDPLSPKIGCMGQVKRNNKIAGFPTSHKFTISTRSNNNVKYFKLKRLFSGKNLTNMNTTTNTNNTTTATTYRRKQENINGTNGYKNDCDDESCVSIRIVDMDPPLPVIKKVHKPSDGGEADNLYKRRSGGTSLRGLQLQNIQLNRHQLELTTV